MEIDSLVRSFFRSFVRSFVDASIKVEKGDAQNLFLSN